MIIHAKQKPRSQSCARTANHELEFWVALVIAGRWPSSGIAFGPATERNPRSAGRREGRPLQQLTRLLSAAADASQRLLEVWMSESLGA